ncbi:ATP-binding protein [Paucibacter aquatile]|uniref:histidine kinase n=1 Tax=Kinneretia aquatilis TaxID=2070761 RepID=A0A2N8KUD3_9BURK|nr:HAMP domain-containing sensor histidine kinase [Paucibacter aquatile]PND37066.1 ATP-binding protein [Paucibacter aquatile]
MSSSSSPNPPLPAQPPAHGHARGHGLGLAPELSLEAGLQQLRELGTGFEQAFFAERLQALQAQALSAAHELELAAFELLGRSTAPAEDPKELLVRARDLLDQAQAQESWLACAASWRAIQWIQTRLKLHHAALESVAQAVALYEKAGHPELALLMQAARCPVLFMAEMYPELREACAKLLLERERLPVATVQMLLNSAASAAYYLANEEPEPRLAHGFWQECLHLHQESLALTERHGLVYAGSLAHLNLSVVHATLGQGQACRQHLEQLRFMAGDKPLPASWQLWMRLCAVLLDCHEASGGPTQAQAWHALLAVDAELAQTPSYSVGHRDAVLQALRQFGERWGYMDQALRAGLTQLQQERERKRELSRALGETVHAVMERPRLLQANAQLTRQGSELEQSLAQRNQELSHALAKVQAEASIRAAAEAALQKAHDELEAQVRARSAELELALRTLMRQEKQLALSRMVVGVAHEMNTPLGNARMAASTMQDQCQDLRAQTQLGQLRRSELDQALNRLQEGSELVDRNLARAGQLVERFKALAISQHQEAPQQLDLAAQLRQWAQAWQARLPGPDFRLDISGLPERLAWQGFPRALHEVLDQLFDNSLQHGWAGRTQGWAGLALSQIRTPGDETEEREAVQLLWQDDGPGIPAEHLPHVLEPFFSTRLGQGGSGLGLSTAHSLVCELMGGRLELQSPPGQGCQVRITLPLSLSRPSIGGSPTAAGMSGRSALSSASCLAPPEPKP